MSNADGPEFVREQNYVEPAAQVVPPPPVMGQVVAQPVVPQQLVTQQPVVAQPVVAQPVVAQPVVVAPAAAVRTAYSRRFAPDAIIASLVGLVLLIVGLLAIVRGGFDGPMEDPIVEVVGFSHTTTLGLIEAVLGTFLLICGVSAWRSGAMFFGAILGIGGFIGAVQTDSFTESLALESSHAWLATIAGVVVVLAALLIPRYSTRSTEVRAV